MHFYPFEPYVLRETLRWFFPTLVVFSVVLGFAARQRRRRMHGPSFTRRLESRARERRRRTPAVPDDGSALWVLPLFVWAFQAVMRVDRLITDASSGLTSPEPGTAWVDFYTVGLSLAALIFLQALAVRTLDPSSPPLGLSRGPRTAARFAVVTVFLDGFFWFGISSPAFWR